MDDLISRSEIYERFFDGGNGIAKIHVTEVDAIPTVDAAPVVHGQVLDSGNPICGPCSECGESVNRRWHYCPNCDARMDLSEGEEARDDGK